MSIYDGAFSFSGEIKDVVRHYETLHTGDIFHDIHKRDVNKKEKILSFTTLNRYRFFHSIVFL